MILLILLFGVGIVDSYSYTLLTLYHTMTAVTCKEVGAIFSHIKGFYNSYVYSTLSPYGKDPPYRSIDRSLLSYVDVFLKMCLQVPSK